VDEEGLLFVSAVRGCVYVGKEPLVPVLEGTDAEATEGENPHTPLETDRSAYLWILTLCSSAPQCRDRLGNQR
jgi:hypothetical protein